MFKCNQHYTYSGDNTTCVADTQIVNCGGTLPSNATGASSYTQTWSGSIGSSGDWTPTKNWTYSTAKGACDFECYTNYTYSGNNNTCVETTRIVACT
jgi:hypothetical protein